MNNLEVGRRGRSNIKSRVVRKTRYGFMSQLPGSHINPEKRIKTEANQQYHKRTTQSSILHSNYSLNSRSQKNQVNSLSKRSLDESQINMPRPPELLSRTQNIYQEPPKPKVHPNMQAIEARMDELLQQKIALLLELNKARLEHDAPKQRKFRDKILTLSSELKQYLEAIQDNSDIDRKSSFVQKWRMLDGRLQLLEKNLAECKTQLDIMKSYYSIFANSRTEYKEMCHPLKTSAKDSYKLQRTHIYRSIDHNSTMAKANFPLTSTANQSYGAPAEEDYEKYRYRYPNYERNANPLPSSSYKQSYQNYSGGIQQGSLQLNNQLERLGPYDIQYVRKNLNKLEKVQRTNYKQLDCFVDKFKSIGVSYMDRGIYKHQRSNTQFAKIEKEINAANRRSVEPKSTPPIADLNTTTKMSYKQIEEDDQMMFRNQPKNNRLEHYALGYKNLFKV